MVEIVQLQQSHMDARSLQRLYHQISHSVVSLIHSLQLRRLHLLQAQARVHHL